MTASAPQTEREILNSLHLSGRKRPWYASLFDEENNRGFGIRHLILLIVTATICISVVSLFKSSASKVPTMVMTPPAGAASPSSMTMSVHHLDFPKQPKTLFIVGRKDADAKECDRVKDLADKVGAPLVVVVGGTGNDVKNYISECGKDDGSDDVLVWMFAVDATITTAMKKNILADNHFFSVIGSRKGAGYEILTAKPGPAASSTSPVGQRIAASPLPAILVTNSEIKMEKPTPGLVRLSVVAAGGALSLDLSDAGGVAKRTDTDVGCVSMSVDSVKTADHKGLMTFTCVEKSG